MSAIFEWIASEGYLLPLWWGIASLAGLAVLPLNVRLLRSLPDRGFMLARPLGILLIGFVYWVLASYGFFDNTPGGILLAWLIVFVASLAIYVAAREDDDESFSWRAHWKTYRRVLLSAEVIFIVMLAAMMMFRAFQNDTGSTEKPMDLMFISSIMRSDTFPPNDAWLAGYSISYYYFGYLMVAGFSMLSGISSGLGYSMGLALFFALVGLTAFAVVANWILSQDRRQWLAISLGSLGVFFVVLMGNLQLPLIELPYRSYIGNDAYFEFWGQHERLSAQNPDFAPSGASVGTFTSPLTHPQQWTGGGWWWWFRGSRVLTDVPLGSTQPAGAGHPHPIDEFPAFSFVLGDAHPHVMALPFVLMTIGIALSIVLRRDPIRRWEIVLHGLVGGGLIFLNAWDGPVYLAVLVGALAVQRLVQNRGKLYIDDWAFMVAYGMGLFLTAVLAYLPFFISFRSQAAGLLPSLEFLTAFRRFFIMFGFQLVLIVPFLLLEIWRGRKQGRMNWSLGFEVGSAVLVILLALLVLVASIDFALAPPGYLPKITRLLNEHGGWGGLLPLLIERRLSYGLVAGSMLLGVVLIVARLFPKAARPHLNGQESGNEAGPPYSTGSAFALLLLGVGISLALIPEFVYLRDNFGQRINTIFKFYYQTWATWSLVSAYVVYSILFTRREWVPSRALRGGFIVICIGVLLLGSLYPRYATYGRAMVDTGYFSSWANNPPELTMDGTSRMTTDDDIAAIECLVNLVDGDDAVVAEISQQSYRSNWNRVGSITGIPTVLGWANHQRQWRGATYDETAGSRQEDLRRLYSELRFDVAQRIIEQYDIDYIMYGSTERQFFAESGNIGEEKFIENLDLVCDFGNAKVYRTAVDLDLMQNR